MTTVVLIRHAKSDWGAALPDPQRPLAPRGRRQAPATGRWLAEHGLTPTLALVSPAMRARQTWDLVAAQLPEEVTTRIEESAYTFDGEDLLRLLRDVPTSSGGAEEIVALVGHNPAMEEIVELLTGRSDVPMPTSALAVIDVPDLRAADGSARLLAAGRPATEHVPGPAGA